MKKEYVIPEILEQIILQTSNLCQVVISGVDIDPGEEPTPGGGGMHTPGRLYI